MSNINILPPQTVESHQIPEQITTNEETDDSIKNEVVNQEDVSSFYKCRDDDVLLCLIQDKDDGKEDEEEEELVFPIMKLVNLEEKIHSQRWIVPVLPEQELLSLLNVTVEFCKRGLDGNNEGCQKFFRDAMVLSFTRILTDDAVNSWKVNIQQCIMNNCMKLVELLVLKLDDDNFPFLEMFGMLFNPLNK